MRNPQAHPSLGTPATMSPCSPGPSHRTSGLFPCMPDPHNDVLRPCSRSSRSLGSPAWLNASLGSACLHLPVMTPFMHQGAGANMHCVSYAVPATVQLIDSCQEAYRQCCSSYKFTCSVAWVANPAHGCRVNNLMSRLITAPSQNLGRRISCLILRLKVHLFAPTAEQGHPQPEYLICVHIVTGKHAAL